MPIVSSGAKMRRSLHARERTKNGLSSVETTNGRETWETVQIVSERLVVICPEDLVTYGDTFKKFQYDINS